MIQFVQEVKQNFDFNLKFLKIKRPAERNELSKGRLAIAE